MHRASAKTPGRQFNKAALAFLGRCTVGDLHAQVPARKLTNVAAFPWWINMGKKYPLDSRACHGIMMTVQRMALERVMNSISNGLGMRETETTWEPSRPWNPYLYAIFAQVHNTLYK